jgi:prepilin-type N-terminal cleavage/methylation domain-containing protein
MIKNKRGFNLTELMVVIAVIGIVGLIAVPSLVTALPGYRLKSSAKDLCSNLRKARSLAVKQNRPVTIEFKTDTNAYTIDTGDPIALPGGVTFGHGNATAPPGDAASIPSDSISFTDNKVTFTTQGLISGGNGYIYLQNIKGQAYAVGARTSGSIVMRQWANNTWK